MNRPLHISCLLLSCALASNGGRVDKELAPEQRLIINDWETLAAGTTIRYFNPANYFPDGSEDQIWAEMGEDIQCEVHDDLTVSVAVPPGFDATKKFKVVTHGFASHTTGGKTAFVNAWMQTTGQDVNVILINWPDLAFFGQVNGWDDFFYDAAARNAIDVGEYLGHCFAGMHQQYGIDASQFHLIGHSLGAHQMGKAGRIFTEITGGNIARITGLDPAGPRFVDGPIMPALPELNENRLSPESASFVDVIHTNGDLEPAAVWIVPHSGDLHALGHMDFYPAGGSAQPGCQLGGPDALPGGVCSHRRSTYYFLHSIWEPLLFPSRECPSVEECNEGVTIGSENTAYMGEISQEYFTGSKTLYFGDINGDHWDYGSHN